MDKITFAAVALGGAIGSVLRFWISTKIESSQAAAMPWGTLTVNIIGSLLIGLLIAFYDNGNLTNNWRLLLVTGFCGGFTTFSTFSLETIKLMKTGNYQTALLYIFISLVICLAATFGGYAVVSKLK